MPAPQVEVLVSIGGTVRSRFVLGPGAYLIGRSPDCALYVDDKFVARNHARLTIGSDGLLIEDLGSSNGTRLDGQPITSATPFRAGQRLEIGGATLEFRPCVEGTLPPEEAPRERKYEVGPMIARGGMGAVLAARQSAIQREVAMKVMLPESQSDDHRRFILEAQITGQLEHPNIVPVHELAADEHGQPYYTMKLVRGITLKKVIDLLAEGIEATVKKYPLPVRLTIFQKVCDAVAFAHSRGVIHRDLKPANIMLGDFGEVLVMDWGLAKVVARNDEGRMTAERSETAAGGGGANDERAPVPSSFDIPHSSFSHTLSGTIMGTLGFMAPEQANGEIDALDARTDIFALGAILFHLLHLRPAFSGRTANEVLGKTRLGEIDWEEPDADANGPRRAVPASLVAVCRKALAADPGERYQSVGELQADLGAYQGGFATSAESAGLARQILLALKRHKAVATSIAAALLILVAVVAVAFVRITGERRRAERALAELRQTAPTFAAQAETLMGERRLDDAITKLDFVLAIDPRNSAFLRQRANYLQAAARLDEAIPAYRALLTLTPDDPTARENLALCEKLAARADEPDAQRAIFDALTKQQRHLEAATLSQQLGFGSKSAEALIKEVLKPFETLPEWKVSKGPGSPPRERMSKANDGTFAIYLNKLPINDLSFLSRLQGLPIYRVELSNTLVRDLAPLTKLPLRELYATGLPITSLESLAGAQLKSLSVVWGDLRTLEGLRGIPLTNLSIRGQMGVRDLKPLTGMPLTDLDISACPGIKTLSPLAGMPLKFLKIDDCPGIKTMDGVEKTPLAHLEAGACASLRDISALRGLPLRVVDFTDCKAIRDLSPLLDCPTLEQVATHAAPGFTKLRTLPNLKAIGYSDKALKPAAEFWAEYDAQQAAGKK